METHEVEHLIEEKPKSIPAWRLLLTILLIGLGSVGGFIFLFSILYSINQNI